MLNRRNWIRNSVLGIAGTALLTPKELIALNEEQTQLWQQLKGKPTDEAYWNLVKNNFVVADGLHYFNNGSLGTCPAFVVKATNQFRATLDGFPSKYMWGGWDDQKEEVRKKAAALFNVSPETIALIHNTTEGMNLVASSMDLKAGDEVLLSNHEHSSARIPWQYWQEEKGIKLTTVDIPLVPKNKKEIVDQFAKAITKKTKVISIVHVTNTNGMILPVKEISALAKSKGIKVAVDGAQSMGMFDIDLDDLGCDYYTSSAHKWLFAPKGIGIFYAREEAQAALRPLIVARGYQNRTIRRFENYNTRNLPELLGLGAALDYRELVGSDKIHARSYELKQYFRMKLADTERFQIKTPIPDDLSAAIQTVEVVGQKVGAVRRKLTDDYQIDCRPMSSHDLNGLRISLAIFITKADIDYLAEALEAD
jgi:selenocysteine lyase/cysteine desulfurase